MDQLQETRDRFRSRLYESYASTHAGHSNDLTSAALIYRRDIRPHLPEPPGIRVLDIGCGQGQLVRFLLKDGYAAKGIDISPEQVMIAGRSGLHQVVQGDFRTMLHHAVGSLDVIVATDVLEHQVKDEVLETLDLVVRALKPGGIFVARVPNAVSPFGGNIRHGDFTHETSYTPRSVAQIAAAVGFDSIDIAACPPLAHGVKSAARALAWKPISGFLKLALAAETGTVRGHVVTQNMTFVARCGRPGPAGPA